MAEGLTYVALDFETYRIGPGALAPKAVCCSFAERDPDGTMRSYLLGNHPEDELEAELRALLIEPSCLLVTHSGGFDWAVAMAAYPRLIPLIFDALEAGRCTDTLWREKLLNLSTTGRLENLPLPDGSSKKVSYSLAALLLDYGGPDRTAEKADLEESWRANYSVLDGWRASEYPPEARDYALADACDTLWLYERQEERKRSWPASSTATEGFRIAAHLCLYLMSAWGMEVDQEYVAFMRRKVDEKSAACDPVLIRAGWLRPGTPAEPYVRQQEEARQMILEAFGPHCSLDNLEPYREWLEGHGIRFKAGKEPSRDTKKIQAHLQAIFERLGEIPAMTEGGSRAPSIKFDAEVQDHLAEHDELVAVYRDREALSKIRTGQLPVLEGAQVVHFGYDALKETGRTSSYDAGKGKGDERLYPSANGQNVPKQIEDLDPRMGYRPREGTVFWDVDYTNLELACVGQVTYDLFGESVHLDLYNRGYDLHAFLGSGLSRELAADGPGREFAETCRSGGLDREAAYRLFLSLKKHEEEPVCAFYKNFRNLAKPIGLGFPGGIGPAKMVTLARNTYGVTMTEEQAREFREVWRATYPEMPRFFDWIEGQTDHYCQLPSGESAYWYETPLGMIRRGASFCAAANGKSMQSPGAEAAEAGMFRVTRECCDPTLGSVLYGCRPIAFVHDQVVGETTRDQSLWHDQCMRVRELMCRAAELVLRNIKMRSDEAHLTTRWSKRSEPTFGSDGRLVPWQPK